ncbi:MAG: Nucleotidyltransferase domain protein [Candidatus Argoarchaeum ethanivorans]|uniref:Nucleotidyltransferase domain protein n=1 Tax=Candidatus Argoarchaeum ethanivorans TaxID=2608793 RepID=A0A811T6R5_9EURY|nr:MAG: Nucleotidyltransferase domain protein [Candidatus Argoarchaeum ethanivorans]
MNEDLGAHNKVEKGLTDPGKEVVGFLSKQEHVKLAYLFGSVAEGKQGWLSDIDLAVFLDESLSKNERFNLQLKLISDLTGILKTDKVDLVIMNDAPLSLNYEIIKANHPLLVRDEEKKIDLEHGILSRYLDRRYYEKRWAAELLKRVAERGI